MSENSRTPLQNHMTEFICGLRSAASVVYPVVKGEITKVAFRNAWAPKNRTDDTFAPRKLIFMGMYFERILFLRTSLFSESAQAKQARL